MQLASDTRGKLFALHKTDKKIEREEWKCSDFVLLEVVLKVMADMPDLSHLTPEERAIIENVMQRQKQEEESEKELMKWV